MHAEQLGSDANTWTELTTGPTLTTGDCQMTDGNDGGCDFSYIGTDCGRTCRQNHRRIASTVYSEMASMFYDTLGNLAFYDTFGNSKQPGWGFTNTGLFNNVQSRLLLVSTSTRLTPFMLGTSNSTPAARPVTKNPMNSMLGCARRRCRRRYRPSASVWLFGSGLLGLVGIRPKRKEHSQPATTISQAGI